MKQAPRRMRLDLEEKVVSEMKLIESGFITKRSMHADWIANIVHVRKKKHIRACIDFRD